MRSSVSRRLAVGLILLLVVVFAVSLQGCSSNLPDGVVAQVGSVEITQEQLDELLAAHEAAGDLPDKGSQGDAYRLFMQKTTEYLVTLEVMYQEAPNLGVTVTQEDIDDGVDEIRRFFLGDEARFQAAVAELGLTMEQLTKGVEQKLWFDKTKAAVTESVAVREDEVKSYYQEHQAEYVLPESREVRHILISPFLDAAGKRITDIPTQTDWDTAEIEAAKVRSEIMNGANFVTMVEEYSDDEPTKTEGGSVGEIVRGETAPTFEQAVFALQKGEMSQPVRTPLGYHIIEVVDITPSQQLAYDSVKEQIRSELLEEKEAEVWEEWLVDTMTRLGVVYRDGYAPPGAVIVLPSTTTTLGFGLEGAVEPEGVSEETTTTTAAEE